MEWQPQESTLVRASRPARSRVNSMFGGPQLSSFPNPASSTARSKGLWASLNTPVKMTLAELCSHALSCDSSATTHVLSISCYKERQGVRHEFLVVHIKSGSEYRWMRLERAAQGELHEVGFRQMFQSSASVYPPDDTAIISSTPDLALGDAKLMEHIKFSRGNQPTLLVFATLLAIFMRESVFYSLPNENCWFFCSVIIENLAKNFGSDVKPRNRSLGSDVRRRIGRLFGEIVSDNEGGNLHP